MHWKKRFLAARVLLILLLAGGLAGWFFVRAPEGTSAGVIFQDVQLVGQTHELVLEVVGVVRRVAALQKQQMARDAAAVVPVTDDPQEDNSAEELARLRHQTELLDDTAHRINADIQSVKSQWIPVAEATDLLDQCRGLCGQTLDSTMPVAAIVAGEDAPIELSDVLAQRPGEVAPVLETRAEHLIDQSNALQARVEQAIESGMFARGTLLGFSSSDLLLACLMAAVLIALGGLWHATSRLSVPPELRIEMELELIGHTDRTAALRRCHERVQHLLELSDGYCREGTA